MAQINKKQLILELKSSEKILVREAEQIIKKEYFDPAVKEMIKDIVNHPVTKEINGGIDSKNISNTLGGGDKNLYSFIGFEDGDDPIEPILEKISPLNPDGPKIKYIRGSNKNNLEFNFAITAPNQEAIENATPMPWADGLSWVSRIEKGIPGLNRFLNKFGVPSSRSGGGIQVKNKLREARFKNISYLSGIFNKFIDRFK
jgi:hypothetical protein